MPDKKVHATADLQALLKAAHSSLSAAESEAREAEAALAKDCVSRALDDDALRKLSRRAQEARELVVMRGDHVAAITRQINLATQQADEAARRAATEAKRTQCEEREGVARELDGAAKALAVAFARFLQCNREVFAAIGGLPSVQDVPDSFVGRHLQTYLSCRLAALTAGQWEARGFTAWQCQQMPTLAQRARADNQRFLQQLGVSPGPVTADDNESEPPEAA